MTSPAEELRQAAEYVRDAVENRYRCWMDNMFDQTVAGHVVELLEDEATEMERMAKESIYGSGAVSFVYEAGEVAPILKLARAINAKAATGTKGQP